MVEACLLSLRLKIVLAEAELEYTSPNYSYGSWGRIHDFIRFTDSEYNLTKSENLGHKKKKTITMAS